MKVFRRRRRIQPASSGSSPTQLMNLSLFIMLLAFFIVLNAISSFEEFKVKPIIDSLEDAFATDVRQQDTSPSMMQDPLASIHDGDTLDRIEALFEAQIRTFETTKSKTAGVMMVELELEEFINSIMAVGQRTLTPDNSRNPPQFYFLPTLVSILQSDRAGITYRMDMLLHTDDNPAVVQNRDPNAVRELVNQGGIISQRLENIGMSTNVISIGVKEGDVDK
ncbi:MAG: flagellar motor protein MotB, partial [Pseudomonadota bacterium]